MVATTVKFGRFKANENENWEKSHALSNAEERLGDAKRELFREGDLDDMRLDAEHPQQLEQMIHERLQSHAQDIAHYAGLSARDGVDISDDDIYHEAMDLLSEQVQMWADDNDIDLDFA